MVEAGSLRENIPGTGLDAGTATVGDLQSAITSGQLTSADLTAFYLARIERLNPDLRAVITVSESAAADARASDEARAARAANAAGDAQSANWAGPLASGPPGRAAAGAHWAARR